MTRWSLETSHEFEKVLRKLDRTTSVRLTAFLDDLVDLDDPRSRGKGLTGHYSGLWTVKLQFTEPGYCEYV